jgi:hypothetical protein
MEWFIHWEAAMKPRDVGRSIALACLFTTLLLDWRVGETDAAPVLASSVSTSTAADQLPDLVISNVRMVPRPTVPAGAEGPAIMHRGTTYTFRVEVSNVGSGTFTGPVMVSARYTCPGMGSTRIDLGTANVPPGESRLTPQFFSVCLGTAQVGECRFWFVVDPHNLIEESDENNNEWRVTLAVQ